MKKFQLKNVTDDEIVGTYDTKVDAIEAMNEVIDETNEVHDETEEDGLSPFDFRLELVEVDYISAIKTFEEARKYLNLPSNAGFIVSEKALSENCSELKDVAAFVQEINPHHLKALVALNRLFTIAEAWNKEDGFVPYMTQWKHHPWFTNGKRFSGFVYAGTDTTVSTAAASLGSRLCFKTGERAKEFGEKYAALYNEVFTI